MSGRIVNEVLERAPEDLTPAQLLVLIALAEAAPEGTRIATHKTSLVDLSRRTRRPRGTVKNALGQLVARGLIQPMHRGQIGTVQHYRLPVLQEHHRHATAGRSAVGETA